MNIFLKATFLIYIVWCFRLFWQNVRVFAKFILYMTLDTSPATRFLLFFKTESFLVLAHYKTFLSTKSHMDDMSCGVP